MALRRGQHRAGLQGWGPAFFSALAVLLIYLALSAGRVTHGFVAYFAASRALITGQLGPAIYDDHWFRRYVQELTGTGVLEVFGPNAPTTALMALPVAPFDHAVARSLWLLASLAAFAFVVVRLIRTAPRDAAIPALLTAVVMLQPAVIANLRTGQAYLFVCALLAAACLSLLRDRPSTAGMFLGLALALKSSGVALLVLLAARRRWTPVAVAIGIVAAGAGIVLMTSDARIWLAYPRYVQAFVASPASSVTAYQTTAAMIRHLCVADDVWNRAPAAECAGLAMIVPPVVLAAALALTIARSREAPMRAWLAAGVCLSELVLPVAAEPHFVSLTIPLLLLWPFDELGRWRVPFLVLVAALLLVPLDYTALVFTEGWSALAAYPRLYAAWLLWGAAVYAMRAEGSTAAGVWT